MEASPDLTVTLPVEPYAPLQARHAVATVDNPSPDLRDVVVLLVSELVTNSLRHAEFDGDRHVEVRTWMPPDTVRVEVVDPGVSPPPEEVAEHHGVGFELVEQLSDRWGVDCGDGRTCVWFEIDR